MPADGMNAAVKAKADIGASGWQLAKSYMIYQAPAMLVARTAARLPVFQV
jgi:hypothetical protein